MDVTCCYCCACVPESRLAVTEVFGKYSALLSPGFHFISCCTGESVAGTLSLRVRQINVQADTKTKDNVFVTLIVAVQYQVIEKEAYTAYFKLSDPHRQITSYVCDVVRSAVPKMILDDVFENKENIAQAVKTDLTNTMESIGYHIKQTLVTDISPDPTVKAAMNQINAAARMRMAAVEKAEAEKIMSVKSAEAEAESKFLSGVGIARQRKAISDGLRDSVIAFTEHVPGSESRDVTDLILVTQYFDTLKDLGEHARAATIFLPHSPDSVTQVAEQIRKGMHTGQREYKQIKDKKTKKEKEEQN